MSPEDAGESALQKLKVLVLEDGEFPADDQETGREDGEDHWQSQDGCEDESTGHHLVREGYGNCCPRLLVGLLCRFPG